jgi:hypothetical protein
MWQWFSSFFEKAFVSRVNRRIDRAVAHLAGALGKPVWVLLGFMPRWLSLLERTESPWYPSMRLFRARSWGGWNSVFDAAASELMHQRLHND